MKATFDVTVKIDGRNVGVSLAMRDGAKDVDTKVVGKLFSQMFLDVVWSNSVAGLITFLRLSCPRP